MEQLIKLVRTYRLTAGLAERLRLAEEIFRLIEPDLRFFIFGTISETDAKDILQETLKGISKGLKGFQGQTKEEFWGWCYTIARNKRNDYFRKKKSTDRVQSIAPGRALAVG